MLLLCNLFQARLTEKKFRPASAFILFCVEVQMLHHYQSYRSLNSWLLHRLPDVMLSVCLLSWTHTLLNCKLGSLSVLMPLNSVIPEVLHDLHGLLRTWPVPLHRRPLWNASFLSVGCSIMDDEELCSLFRCLDIGVCLKLRQCWKKRLAHRFRLSENWC